MIENTAQLQQALEQMGRMQRILDSYRTDILPKNPRNFAVLLKDRSMKSASCRSKSQNTSHAWNKRPQSE